MRVFANICGRRKTKLEMDRPVTNRLTWFAGRPVLAAAFASLFAAAAMTCLAQTASAQPASLQAAKPWQSLTASQREALSPLEKDWTRIDPARQQKWLEVAGRFPSMAVEERERVQRRMADWARMTPEERGRARLNYQELRLQTDAEERQTRWQAYQSLPETQRRELAKRANDTKALASRAAVVPPSRVDGVKSAVVKAPAPATVVKTVRPTVVQTAPGATTSLVSQRPTPPLHQQTGLPKMTAKPGFVDQRTLLPKRGAQGAAVASGQGFAPPTDAP